MNYLDLLQHTSTHCDTLQQWTRHFTHRNMLQCTLMNYLQHPATPCNTLQHTVTHCNTLQHTATVDEAHHTSKHATMHFDDLPATHCNTLQHTTTPCNTLQHSATHCNTLQQWTRHITHRNMLQCTLMTYLDRWLGFNSCLVLFWAKSL